jgi:DMSO/TMAO reductase YedYZ heme-binding membrane subunit
VTGPRLYAVCSLAVAAMCAAIVALAEAPAPLVVRWTARTSLALFALVYVARPATQLWPAPLTRGLLARRKWLGLAFATSHAFHLAGIIGLGWPEVAGFFARRPPNPLGVASFVLLAAMSVTSIDRVKAAMSRRVWRALHLAGVHVAWLVFAGTYARHLEARPGYAAPLALLVALALVRAAAFVRHLRRPARRPAREVAR